MEPEKREARKTSSKPADEQLLCSLKITRAADRQLTASAEKINVGKGEYASAAIAFFAESGLDPTQERPQGLGEISSKVAAETLAVRKQNVDIGNRLIGIIRTWEANLYGFMKQQELAQNTYLAAIERNILERVVAMETHFMGPMVEQIFKASIEAYVGRVVSERIYLQVSKKESSEWAAQHESLSKERDQVLGKKLEEYAEAHPPVRTMVTPKPALTPAPIKPVAPPAAGTPAPATPAPAGPPKP